MPATLPINVKVTVEGVDYNFGIAPTGSLLAEIPGYVIAADTDPHHYTSLQFLAASVVALVAKCDRALTVKSNSSGSPGDTLTLEAGTAFVFGPGIGENPFADADVTSLYFTQEDGSLPATLTMFLLLS